PFRWRQSPWSAASVWYIVRTRHCRRRRLALSRWCWITSAKRVSWKRRSRRLRGWWRNDLCALREEICRIRVALPPLRNRQYENRRHVPDLDGNDLDRRLRAGLPLGGRGSRPAAHAAAEIDQRRQFGHHPDRRSPRTQRDRQGDAQDAG